MEDWRGMSNDKALHNDKSTYHVRLASKNRTKWTGTSYFDCRARTSSGGTGMGTPLWKYPVRGILGLINWNVNRWNKILISFRRETEDTYKGWIPGVASAFGPNQI